MTLRKTRRNPGRGSRHRTHTSREWCSVGEAAESLGVSASTVWRWVDAGKLPAVRLGPKAIRIRRADVAAAVRPVANRVESGELRIYSDVKDAIRRLTPEEKRRGLEALAAADSLRARIRARRKGKPLPDSADLIRRAREERSRHL